MGRLQKKKPDNKKKKKKQPVEGQIESGSKKNNETGNKVVSLTDFSKIRKKQSISQKKSAPAVKPGEEGRLEKTIQFFREVRIELKKVTWPSRTQTIGTTVVVIIIVAIIAAFLGLIDGLLALLVRLVL